MMNPCLRPLALPELDKEPRGSKQPRPWVGVFFVHFSANRDMVKRDMVERDVVGRDMVERDMVERDMVERDTVLRDVKSRDD